MTVEGEEIRFACHFQFAFERYFLTLARLVATLLLAILLVLEATGVARRLRGEEVGRIRSEV